MTKSTLAAVENGKRKEMKKKKRKQTAREMHNIWFFSIGAIFHCCECIAALAAKWVNVEYRFSTTKYAATTKIRPGNTALCIAVYTFNVHQDNRKRKIYSFGWAICVVSFLGQCRLASSATHTPTRTRQSMCGMAKPHKKRLQKINFTASAIELPSSCHRVPWQFPVSARENRKLNWLDEYVLVHTCKRASVCAPAVILTSSSLYFMHKVIIIVWSVINLRWFLFLLKTIRHSLCGAVNRLCDKRKAARSQATTPSQFRSIAN